MPQKFIKEVNNLVSLDHPNIVKVFDVFWRNDTALLRDAVFGCGCSLSEDM